MAAKSSMPGPLSRELAGGLIASVTAEGSAAQAGVHAGDYLLSINGHKLRDIIDYRFYAADLDLKLEVERDGQIFYRHTEDGNLGIGFESTLFDRVRPCNNECFFCFVTGLPRGARPRLRVKDDDYRLSFLFGNFVTLSNLDEADWDRIAEQRLSPLYVSVHTTDRTLRGEMLANSQAPDILEQLERLKALGIQVHTQVVLCPGVNDGQYLEQTIGDLSNLHPTVISAAVVPVGTTDAGQKRAALSPKGAFAYPERFTREGAIAVLRQMRRWQRQFRSHFGKTFVHAADEFYLLAGKPFPGAQRYDGFPQLENGVGMTRRFKDTWARCKRQLHKARNENALKAPKGLKRLTVACGTLIAPQMADMITDLNQLADVEVQLEPVTSRFFGPSVTVSGLLTGGDLIAGLSEHTPAERVVLTRSALDSTGERFLDDLTPAQVEDRLGTRLTFVSSPRDLVRLIWKSAPV